MNKIPTGKLRIYSHNFRPRTRLSYTTTEKGRNQCHLEQGFSKLAAANRHQSEFNILQIGPGVVLRWRETKLRLLKRGGKYELLKRLESVMRKLPFSSTSYANFETAEIYKLEEKFGKRINLTVMDISTRVLEITDFYNRNSDPCLILKNIGLPFKTIQLTYHMVVCMNVLVHLQDEKSRTTAEHNLTHLCQQNGFLIVDTPSDFFDQSSQFQPIRQHIYRKKAFSHDTEV